ncbi:MAG: protein phosphatase 2C domain-containing protein [Cyanobacteria bacterium P01_G01_bin.49]
MTESVATTQCSNPECRTANPLSNKHCQKCQTPLMKRYLWALGDWIESCEVGQLLDERYLIKADKIVLDTKPGIPPDFIEDIPDHIRTYLKLFYHRLHLPQIYTYYLSNHQSQPLQVCLLEYGTVPLDQSGELRCPNLLPPLTEVWADAQDNPLRQLNWLWQIAKLWQPLESRQMVSSLLDPLLIRVNGGNIQLLELRQDEHSYHSVRELGKFWLSLIKGASPLIADYLQTLCEYLQRGKIPHSEYLLTYFDLALRQCGQWYQQKYQIFTNTDSGPTRDHNEDACYPERGNSTEFTNDEPYFTLVCDGIGGQDGGEIASQLAIDTLVEELPNLFVSRETWNSQDCLQQLRDVIGLANDRISERNDAENRQNRRRMGTTVVLTLIHGHEIYLGHVGDSRIYHITTSGCHQVTVDDDLASREVRLGYLFYRDAIKYPNSGALIQALGMASSVSLHPNVSHLMIDEDCVFLLCSDGLSDYDRVEQYWDGDIASLIAGEKDISTVGNQLIELANQKNGHDNVTISLVYGQISLTNAEKIPLSMAEIEQSLVGLSEQEADDKLLENTSPDPIPTEPLPSKTGSSSSSFKISPLFLSILGIVIIIAGVGAYGAWQLFGKIPESSLPIRGDSPESSSVESEKSTDDSLLKQKK